MAGPGHDQPRLVAGGDPSGPGAAGGRRHFLVRERHAARPGGRAGQGARAARGHDRARRPAAHGRGRARHRARARRATDAAAPDGRRTERRAAAVPASRVRGGWRGWLRGALRRERARRLGPGARLAADTHRERRAERDFHGAVRDRARAAARRPRRARSGGHARVRGAAPGQQAGAGAQRPGGGGDQAHRLPRLHQRPGDHVHAAVRRGARRRTLRGAAHRRAGRVCLRRAGVRLQRRGDRAHRGAAADQRGRRAHPSPGAQAPGDRADPGPARGVRRFDPGRAGRRPGARADRRGHPSRRGGLLRLDSAGRGCGGRRPGAHHGNHAAQPHRSHHDAAAARSRGPGGAQRHRRRGVRGRQEPDHPLPQSAGSATAGCYAKPSGGPFLRRRPAAA